MPATIYLILSLSKDAAVELQSYKQLFSSSGEGPGSAVVLALP